MRVEQIGACTLYLGDCRDVLPTLGKVDAVITDPPYKREDYEWTYVALESLGLEETPGYWFWQCNQPFPMKHSVTNIWSKCNVCVGDAEPYEVIYGLNVEGASLVFRHAVINCEMNATINGDEYHPHPTQKPIKLMRRLVKKFKGTILDPFMGSGTTGVACVMMGRRFIGIEKELKYFDIACKRISEARRQSDLFVALPAKQVAMDL